MKLLRSLWPLIPILIACVVLPLSGAAADTQPVGAESIVYIGTYTRTKSKGIYAYRFDSKTGKVSSLGLAAEASNPSFVAVHPNRKFVYAVSESGSSGARKTGTVSAFSVNPESGKLTLLNQASSGGAGPCHLSVDHSGKYVMVANYSAGSVAVLPVKDDGSLGEPSSVVQHTGSSVDPKRQTKPYAHSINPSPDNRFAIAADLGTDQVLVYRLDSVKGVLSPNDPAFAKVKPGAGPRHFAFHPNGNFGYVINEMHSTVTAFGYDGNVGQLREIQTISTLPKEFQGESSTAEVLVHKSGKFLYGSNRGHDSISVFAVNSGKGTLSLIEQVPTEGKTPRNFGIDPSGRYLFAANQDSDSVVIFRIDEKTGRLRKTGEVLEVGAPVCVRFLPLN